jgi:hypothetical protein
MSKIKTVKTGIDFIKQWVIKTALKQQPKGVLTTLPKKDFVDLNTAITAERLMKLYLVKKVKCLIYKEKN